jgi:SSS family solute:Na+ symporter
MGFWDWFLIALYILAMIGLSVYLSRGQVNQADYYVAGRNLPWWAVGISTMATQTSVISFMSIPSFVALKPGGGLTWLQYELAVPLAMIGVSMLLLPFFRHLELISVYRYLELRFGPQVRSLVSAVFLLSRGLGSGVGLYASAIVLTVMMGVPLWVTILVMGITTLVYDTIGGVRAVVYSDVIQTVILLAGIGLCIFFALEMVGGVSAVIDAVEPVRWSALDMSTGLGDAASTPFWGFLVGGLFLYMAYYGTDQSQVQRELSASSIEDTRHSLHLNGFARFPLTALYVAMGLSLAAVYAASTDLQAQVPMDKLDYLVPSFILLHLPEGVRGIIVAAMLAASMSSLDSALNSLSAATMRDFIEPGRDLSERQSLILGKVTTVGWGLAITGLAFFVGDISDTVIESINKVGSAFYGPILAAFLSGVLSRTATAGGITWGVLGGVGFNLLLWVLLPEVFWMWWNFFGLVVAAAITLVVSRFTAPCPEESVRNYTLAGSGFLRQHKLWRPVYGALVLWFLVLLILLYGLNSVAASLIEAAVIKNIPTLA